MAKNKSAPRQWIFPDNLPAEEQSRFFESILDAIPEFIVYYDNELKVVWANRAASEDAGSQREEMIGRNFFEAACRLKEPCDDCPVVKSLSSEGVEVIESNVHLGRLFYTRCYPVRCGKKRMPGRLLLAQDVSHLRNRYSVTEILNLISEVFQSPKELPDVYREIVASVARRFDYPVGYIMLYDRERDRMVNVGEADFPGRSCRSPCRLHPFRVFLGPPERREGSKCNGLERKFGLSRERLGGAGTETVLAAPLSVDGNVTGAIVLIDFKERLEAASWWTAFKPWQTALAPRYSASRQRRD